MRIVSATHQRLKACVDAGRFRQDLYYRLNVIELEDAGPTRTPEDIPTLVGAALSRLCKDRPPCISEAAMAALSAYSYPGNVRELENILERATALCSSARVEVDDLQLAPPLSGDGENAVARDGESLDEYMNRIERQLILEALAKTGANRTAAARLLGVTFRSLRATASNAGIEA